MDIAEEVKVTLAAVEEKMVHYQEMEDSMKRLEDKNRSLTRANQQFQFQNDAMRKELADSTQQYLEEIRTLSRLKKYYQENSATLQEEVMTKNHEIATLRTQLTLSNARVAAVNKDMQRQAEENNAAIVKLKMEFENQLAEMQRKVRGHEEEMLLLLHKQQSGAQHNIKALSRQVVHFSKKAETYEATLQQKEMLWQSRYDYMKEKSLGLKDESEEVVSRLEKELADAKKKLQEIGIGAESGNRSMFDLEQIAIGVAGRISYICEEFLNCLKLDNLPTFVFPNGNRAKPSLRENLLSAQVPTSSAQAAGNNGQGRQIIQVLQNAEKDLSMLFSAINLWKQAKMEHIEANESLVMSSGSGSEAQDNYASVTGSRVEAYKRLVDKAVKVADKLNNN